MMKFRLRINASPDARLLKSNPGFLGGVDRGSRRMRAVRRTYDPRPGIVGTLFLIYHLAEQRTAVERITRIQKTIGIKCTV